MAEDLEGKLGLVTGATGLIGLHLDRGLLREGAKIRALVRNPARVSAPEQLGVEICTGEHTLPSALQDAVKGCNVIFPKTLAESRP